MLLNDTSEVLIQRIASLLNGTSIFQNTFVGYKQSVQDVLTRVPPNTVETFKALCQNSHVALDLGILWGTFICLSLAAYFVRKRAASKAEKLRTGSNGNGRWQYIFHAWSTFMVILYWYDVITDVLVVQDVWPNWPGICLMVFAMLNYISSGIVMCLHLGRGRQGCETAFLWSLGVLFTVFLMPFFDTLAVVQILLRDLGVEVVQFSNLNSSICAV